MPETSSDESSKDSKKYDLEDRTLAFAKRVRSFVKKLPNSLANLEDGKQVTRSSGSVGANYIEANESLSKKDFILRIKICRKEAKETGYWLKLLDIQNVQMETERKELVKKPQSLRRYLELYSKSPFSFKILNLDFISDLDIRGSNFYQMKKPNNYY